MKKIFNPRKNTNLKYNYYKKYKDIKETIEKRYNILIGIITLVIIILFINLFYIQIIKNNYYKEKLEILNKNIVEGTTAPRGRIYDRNKKLLVDNEPSKEIYYKKQSGVTTKEEIALAYKMADLIDLDFSKLSDNNLRKFWVKNNPDKAREKIKKSEWQDLEYRKITADEIEKLKLERITEEELSAYNDRDRKAAYIYYLMNKGYSYADKIIKRNNVTDEEFANVASNAHNLKGFNTRLDWNRTYLYGDTFRAILGSVSDSESGIPSDLKKEYLKKGYRLNDRVGISYLEYQYDDYLKGIKNEYEILDNGEKVLTKEGKRGSDLVLTIDIELQKKVEEILTKEVVAAKKEPNTKFYDRSFVVITDPKTGEVLAMAGKQVKEENGEYKVYDYTPGITTSPVVVGSVVKGASHIVGYNTGNLQIGEKRYDKCIKLAGAPQKCSWKNLGTINDLTALKLSSNVYQFYTAMKVAGLNYTYNTPFKVNNDAFEKYRNTFAEFGLGVKTEIDLPIESLGYKGQSKVGGLLLDFSIGQYDTYTPIQLSQYISTIANNGSRLKPYLLKGVYSSSDSNLNKAMFENKSKELNHVNTKQEYLDRVKEGFKQVLEYGGTGSGYIDLSHKPAGKTGTSQSFIDSDGDGKVDKETVTTTFVAYAPYDNPQVTFTVISPDIYYSETGSTYQSTVNKRIAKEVSDAYFSMYKTN